MRPVFACDAALNQKDGKNAVHKQLWLVGGNIWCIIKMNVFLLSSCQLTDPEFRRNWSEWVCQRVSMLSVLTIWPVHGSAVGAVITDVVMTATVFAYSCVNKQGAFAQGQSSARNVLLHSPTVADANIPLQQRIAAALLRLTSTSPGQFLTVTFQTEEPAPARTSWCGGTGRQHGRSKRHRHRSGPLELGRTEPARSLTLQPWHQDHSSPKSKSCSSLQTDHWFCITALISLLLSEGAWNEQTLQINTKQAKIVDSHIYCTFFLV